MDGFSAIDDGEVRRRFRQLFGVGAAVASGGGEKKEYC
jgi:hypothetical protein